MLLGLSCAQDGWAQSVNKCLIDGKTVYQSLACPTQGKALTIVPGPSDNALQEARARADAEKSRAAHAVSAAQTRAQDSNSRELGRPVDCSTLSKQRSDAFGHRNATVRSSQQDNIDRSGAVDRYHSDIRSIERQMVSSGCQP